MKKKKKKLKLKKKVKRILLLILILTIIIIIIATSNNHTPKINTESIKANITNYYIYGTNLSLEGTLAGLETSYDKLELVLYNGTFKEYELITNDENGKITFSLDQKVNIGLYLDNLSKDEYYLFIRSSHLDEEKSTTDKKIYNYKYYALNNETEYPETIYYTTSKYNNKISLNYNNSYQTLMFNITKNNDKEIYDLVIDPGHGGIDAGATTKNYTESEIVMQVSSYLKEELEKNNLKVKLTRTENSLNDDEYFEEYNEHGRAVIPNEVHAKYLISIHANSSDSSQVNGVELYTASNIDYTLAENIISNITNSLSINISTRETYKELPGIYTHNFNEAEIKEAIASYDEKGYERYDITTNSNYLYMIREPGGIITGAYIDKRNQDTVGYNPYYNTNIAPESYLLELGYLTNTKDLKILTTKEKEYAKAISKAIIDYLNKK